MLLNILRFGLPSVLAFCLVSLPAHSQTCIQISTLQQLQGIGNSTEPLSGNYCLVNDIDASGVVFVPIGTLSFPFTGTFDGQGHTVNWLTISSSAQYVGLFGVNSGIIRNVGLTNAIIIGTGNADHVGAFAGLNYGTIENSLVTGLVTGGPPLINGGSTTASFAGGVAGRNFELISRSHANVQVAGGGTARAGGIVGINYGTVTRSSAAGSFTGGNLSALGGLVGWNLGSISQSYATGSVFGGDNSTSILVDVGGLTGVTQGTVTQSYATGPVSPIAGNGLTGGLIGQVYFATVNESYSIGAVMANTGGGESVGGLIGLNSSGNVSNSYWNVQTSGQLASAGGTGLTTDAFKSGLPSGFDSSVWAPGSSNQYINSGYPYLAWQQLPSFDARDATLALNASSYTFAPIGQLDPNQYSVNALSQAFITTANSWQALFASLAADRITSADPYNLTGDACLSAVYTMIVRGVAATINDPVSMGATIDLFQDQNSGVAIWPLGNPSLSTTLKKITFTSQGLSTPQITSTYTKITANVGFLSLLEFGPVIVHGNIQGKNGPEDHFMLVTGFDVTGTYLVANDPLLGLQVRFPYSNGVVSRITDVYDFRNATWVPFTNAHANVANYTTISQIAHIEPERFAGNFNALYTFVPQTYETVNIN
jgi:The GLUG motif